MEEITQESSKRGNNTSRPAKNNLHNELDIKLVLKLTAQIKKLLPLEAR